MTAGKLHFIASGDIHKRLAVALINDALPGHHLFEVTKDEADAMRVLVDIPAGFAVRELQKAPRADARRCVVITPNGSAIYRDALRSFGLLAVITLDDPLPTVAFKLSEALTGRRTHEQYEVLSVSETRVVRLLLCGLAGSEIAGALGVTVKTVNAHVSNLLTRVGFTDRAALVAKVLGGVA